MDDVSALKLAHEDNLQNKRMDSIEQNIINLAKSVQKNDHAIFGNGKEGMKDRLTRMETQLKIIAIIGTALLGAVISLVFKMFTS